MAVYTAYFDASGNPSETTSVFVSGYVSTEQKWLDFERRWFRVLRDEGIRPPFHTTDFVRGTRQYAAWRNGDERRVRVLRKLIKVIKDHVHKSFSTGVLVADFDMVAAEYDFAGVYLTPYTLCAEQSIVKTERWRTRTRRPSSKLAFFLERGDAYQDQLPKRLALHNGPLVNFRPKMCDDDRPFGFAPFQACDLIAWQHARGVRDVKQGVKVSET